MDIGWAARRPLGVVLLEIAMCVPMAAPQATAPAEVSATRTRQKKSSQPPAPIVPRVDLADPTSPVRTQARRTGGILGQIACDKNGGVYIQPQLMDDPSNNTQDSSAIIRINPDGSTARFTADSASAPQHSHTYILGHAVDRDGRVFLLTMRPGPGDHVTVLQLAEDSSVTSTTDLDRELRPGLFAVLPNGDFLIGGIEQPEQNSETRKSVLWLFGPDGRFQREFLSASNQVDIDPQTKRPVSVLPTESFSSLQIGDDNNIYVLLPGSPAKLQVFDDSGAKLRTLRLDAPPQARLHPEFFVAGGRIVVPYWSTEKEDNKTVFQRTFRVYDAQTGLPQVDYVSTFRGVVACVDNNDIVFLVTGKDGALSLARASMR